MNILGRFSMTQGEETPFTIDYSDDLEAGDTLTASSAAVDGDGLLTAVYAIYTNGVTPYTKVMLALAPAGVTGTKYNVTVT